MTTHSATLAWKIPWTEEPCRLQSMGSLRVGHDWVTSLHFNNKYKLLSGASQVALVVKESACQCRRHRRHWFYRKIPQKGNGNPFQDSCLRNSMNRGAWRATVCGVAKKVGHNWACVHYLSLSLFTFVQGNGNPLQCSCLENPKDGGAWWAAIYGVTQSRTWLKWLSSSSSGTV